MSLRHVARRASWSFGDQALSSLTNFALAVVVARAVTAEEFGAFGLAFSAYLLVLGLVRAVTAEPLLVRASHVEPAEHARQAEAATGTALVAGVASAVVVGGVGLALGGATRTALVVLAVALPGLLVQDALRYVAISGGRPRAAFVNDAVWAVTQIVAVGAALATGRDGIGWVTGAWGLAAAVAAAVSLVALALRPRPTAARAWLGEHRDLIPSFVGEVATRNAGTRLTVFAVAATAGLAAVGGVRAAQVVTGPATVVLLGATMVTVPEAVRLHRRHPERLPSVVHRTSLGFGALALVVGLAPLLLPMSWGTALLGATWAEARPVLVPQALLLGAMGATSGYLTGLRVLEAARASLGARLVIAPLGLAAGVLGAWWGGGTGAVAGLAAAYWVGVVVWWRQFDATWRATDRPDGAPAGADAPPAGDDEGSTRPAAGADAPQAGRAASSSRVAATGPARARTAGSTSGTTRSDGRRAAMPAASDGLGSQPMNRTSRSTSAAGSTTNRS